MSEETVIPYLVFFSGEESEKVGWMYFSVGALATLCRKAKLISNSGKYFSANEESACAKSCPAVIWHFPNQWKVGRLLKIKQKLNTKFLDRSWIRNFSDSKIFKTSAQFCMEILRRWRLLQRNTLAFSFRASLNREMTTGSIQYTINF